MNETKVFTQGGLNYDTELHLVPATDWVDAENLRIAASDDQLEGAASNIEGNRRVGSYDYAAGLNICIGAFSDELRNVVYAMICNENNFDEIVEINTETGAIVPVFKNLIWTDGVDVLQFEPQNKIHSIDIIHREDTEGDLLFWTDGSTRPRKINILRGKTFGTSTGYPSPIVFSYTYVVKAPPRSIEVSYKNDLAKPTNNLRGKLFQFQSRFVYADYEKSVWSNWSNYAIPVQPFLPDRDSDPTINNYIEAIIPTGDADVVKIEVGVRQNIGSGWGDIYLSETLNKDELAIPDNSTYTYNFYNDVSGPLQAPAETIQVFDYVPTIAGCQSLANGNTLVYADITEGLEFNEPMSVTLIAGNKLLTLNIGDNVLGLKMFSKYKLGLIYFDNYNQTDGVHNRQSLTSPLTFEVNTGEYRSDSYAFGNNYNIYVPVITAAIDHQPPIWAKTYKWVRTNYLTTSKYLYYMVSALGTGDLDNIYFKLDPLTDSIVREGQLALGYDFVSGDRIRLLRVMSGSAQPLAEDLSIDLQIINVLKDPVIINTTYAGSYLKVPKNTVAASISINKYYLAELYRPSNISNNGFYYEFGEEYDVLNPGTDNRYHQGQLQDQTSTLPATFSFSEGDVYYRKRDKMTVHTASDVNLTFENIPISDPNFSDIYASAVNGNGRGFIVDENAKEQRLVSELRYGGAYLQDTFVNRTNNFPAANIIDNCDRSFGIIKRLSVRDRQLRVFQELKCGWLPVQSQVLQTGDGTSVVSQSDQLLNNIQYYEGDFGIGNAPCSLSSENFADYFHDTNRGVICRISQDGLTPISITGKINSFAIVEDVKYKTSDYATTGVVPPFTSDIPGFAQIYGVLITKSNIYISAYQEIATYTGTGPYARTVINTPKTMVWDEVRNRFVTPYLFYPEWMTCLKNTLITFKDGLPYLHDNKTNRCSFYGVDSDWSITVVFNDKFAIKKTFNSIDVLSNEVLELPSIATSLGNESNLIASDFAQLEEHFHAAFLRDANSPGGVIEGDTLKGGYIKCKLQKTAAQGLVVLNSVAVESIASQKNSK